MTTRHEPTGDCLPTARRLLANSEPARSWQAVDELPQKTITLNISTNYQSFFPRARERRKEKRRIEKTSPISPLIVKCISKKLEVEEVEAGLRPHFMHRNMRAERG
ncbi:hypothetical protein [Bacteroides heparinolyticus]|uniref:hypothetical protein n=1 Tax=Prevotella heparinolytica TaxID=28113 RepID=UPI0035A0E77D